MLDRGTFPDRDPSVLVEAMQEDQARRIFDSGVLGRMATASPNFDEALKKEGFPIVLSSETDNLRFIFLAIRSKDPNGDTRSQFFQVGQLLKGQVAIPNEALGVADEDLSLFGELLAEAESLRSTAAPGYSTEYGILL